MAVCVLFFFLLLFIFINAERLEGQLYYVSAVYVDNLLAITYIGNLDVSGGLDNAFLSTFEDEVPES